MSLTNLCRDIDECATTAHECVQHAICTNNPGWYHVLQCHKSQNHHRDALSQVPYHPLKGSYHCNCEDGYDGNGFTSCDLMDECSTVTCGAYAHCEIVFDDTPNANNTINDAECVCDNGFVDSPSPYIRCIKVRSE